MKKSSKKINYKYFLLWMMVFAVSRFYVLANPPFGPKMINGEEVVTGFSDVKHFYERYANMWHYGLTPYREHLFEYPPAAIPLMYVPLLVDQMSIGHYYQNFRVQIFLLEIILFAGILYTISYLPISTLQKRLAILFYIGAGVLAKDFWYDGLDLVFIGSLALALIWRLWHKHRRFWHAVVFWALFWLSVAIKLLTLPLLVPFLFIGIKKWRRELAACFSGGLLVSIVPVVLYRSSLSVILFFHGVRPLKYEAFGTFIIRLFNDFTHTEVQSDIAPHFPMVGPISSIIEQVVTITFPIAILIVLGWSIKRLLTWINKKSLDRLITYQLMMQVTLVYLFALLLSSKILSRPFHIWYVPMIALYPFKTWRRQLLFIMGALLMLALDTSPYLAFPKAIAGVPMERFRDALRFIPMMLLLYSSIRLRVNAVKMKG